MRLFNHPPLMRCNLLNLILWSRVSHHVWDDILVKNLRIHLNCLKEKNLQCEYLLKNCFFSSRFDNRNENFSTYLKIETNEKDQIEYTSGITLWFHKLRCASHLSCCSKNGIQNSILFKWVELLVFFFSSLHNIDVGAARVTACNQTSDYKINADYRILYETM